MTPDLSAFGDLRILRALQGGHRNAVFLVETPQGPAVAKSTHHSEAALAWLAPLQAAARAAGFTVPTFHRARNGNISASGWTVEDWHEGPALRMSDLPALIPRLQAFHAAIPTLPQRPGLCSLPDHATAPLPHLPADIASLCRAALIPLADQLIRPIHGDITPSNLIHSTHGPALIDWDEARCELAFLDFIHVAPANPTEIRAHLAGEIITGWTREPAYAKARANRLAHL